MFEIFNETGKDIKEFIELKKYITYVAKKEQIEDALFNIIFVSNEEIRKINKEYREVDRVTDVISFALEDNETNNFGKRVLGDIYIAIDVAYKQAVEYNHSSLREICFLSTHGILHLLGYDHMNKKEEEVMFKKQEELLSSYGINR